MRIAEIIVFFALLFSISPAFSITETVDIEKNMSIQERIDKAGFKILNANALTSHIVFSYGKKRKFLKGDPSINKRQVVLYDEDLKYIENDDELAAFIARETSIAIKTFEGSMGGLISSMQVKISPKKYEMVADKRAVDYMVQAGYNPLGLITYINKSCPQKRQDTFSKHNLTSKRLMNIYERIYFEYPYFILNDAYIDNPYYQNFLLNSIENRKLLKEKVMTKSKKEIKYE